MKHYKFLLALSLLFIETAVFSGQNENASVFINFDYRNNQMVTVANSINEGDECFISLNVKDVKSLHSYSVKLTFDSNIVRFEGAAKTASFGETSFLESNKGKIAAFLVFPKNGEVEIAASLSGKDYTADGSGVLAYFRFKCIKNGNPAFSVKEIKLVDNKAVMDKIVE